METNSHGKMYMLKTLKNNMLLLSNQHSEDDSEKFLIKDLLNDLGFIKT